MTRAGPGSGPPAAASAVPVEEIAVGPRGLAGFVRRPPRAAGFIVFAHGSGSSRFSERNAAAARRFATAGLGSLLFDLLAPHEAADRRNVFDIALLAERVTEAIDWAVAHVGLPIGLYGASTGAAAALVAAAQRADDVVAVVSRGGRPDLAGAALRTIRAPTLLIVGEDDTQVLALNRQAAEQLVSCERELVTIPGATHLFEEAGALEHVIELAADWFSAHCPQGAPAARR